MSDISIPTGAMMALYNLKKINADLVSTQNEISTGRIVNGPKDNSAVWTQTEKMKFEHAGYDVINRQIGAAEASLSVGRAAAENIVDVLEDLKATISQTSPDEGDLIAARDAAKTQIDDLIKMASVNGQSWVFSNGNESVTVGFQTTTVEATDTTPEREVRSQFTINIAKKNLRTISTGALFELANLSFTDPDATTASQSELDIMIEDVRNAASHFGENEARLARYIELNTTVSNSLQKGISSLIDADLEAASSRLQALQVQQQLSIQALSIANREPQNLLALFG
jgi:flagellin